MDKLVCSVYTNVEDRETGVRFSKFFSKLSARQCAEIIGQLEEHLEGMRENLLLIADREDNS